MYVRSTSVYSNLTWAVQKLTAWELNIEASKLRGGSKPVIAEQAEQKESVVEEPAAGPAVIQAEPMKAESVSEEEVLIKPASADVPPPDVPSAGPGQEATPAAAAEPKPVASEEKQEELPVKESPAPMAGVSQTVSRFHLHHKDSKEEMEELEQSSGHLKLAFVHQQLCELVEIAKTAVKLNERKRLLKSEMSAQKPSKFGKMFEALTSRLRTPSTTLAFPSSDLSDIMSNGQLEKKIEETRDAVKQYMHRFDLQRAIICWLIRDFDLSRALIQVQNRINMKHVILMREKAQADEKNILELEELVNTLERQRNMLWNDLMANDKESIVLGLHILDKNYSGKIETSDMNCLSSTIFNDLDKDCDHAISTLDLKTAVSESETKHQTIYNNIKLLERDMKVVEEELTTLRNELEKLGAEEESERKSNVQILVEEKDVEFQKLQDKLQQMNEDLAKVKELITIVEATFYKTFKDTVWYPVLEQGMDAAKEKTKQILTRCVHELQQGVVAPREGPLVYAEGEVARAY